MRQLARILLYGVLGVATATDVLAQGSTAKGALSVQVLRDTTAVADAIVKAAGTVAMTDAHGIATLRLPAGDYRVTVMKLGFRPETLLVRLVAGRDTTIAVQVVERGGRIAPILVTSTRTERRIEDEPLRIEVLSGEDISEKNEMRPADLRNLLREMSGVRVQATTPTLGGAAIRLQGLPGRYALVLNDGLPLYGTQSGGFGLVQVPPLDLRQAEVIKGAATALYGPSALSGVVDLVSRLPSDTTQVLVNQTIEGGTDVLGFDARPLSSRSGLTVLAGVHRQRVADMDGDGWSDIPAMRRAELRPRLFYDDSAGRSLMATAGGFAESRSGGAVRAPAQAGDGTFVDSLTTRHGDAGVVGRWPFAGGWSLSLRSSANAQSRRRRIGSTLEREQQGTISGELTATGVTSRQQLVTGAAWQRDAYSNRDAPAFDQSTSTPAIFVQHTLMPASWLGTTVNARCDISSTYGTICTPRASVLVHRGSTLSARASAGAGWFAPMALNDETEAIGLSHVVLPKALEAERARTMSLDVTATRGPLQANATLFSNRIGRPIGIRPFASASGDTTTLVALVNGPGTLRTWGGEVFGVLVMEPIIATAYVASTRSRELSPETGLPRELSLTPREEGGLDLAYEEDETGTYVAAEVFYTGRQALENDPYRPFGTPYTTVGLLTAQRIRRATVFVNVENITDVRLSRFEPVRRPSPGEGGRLTVDAWAPLEGRVFNAGIRYAL